MTGRLAELRGSREPGMDRLPGEHADVLALDRLGPAEREAIRFTVWEDLPAQDRPATVPRPRAAAG